MLVVLSAYCGTEVTFSFLKTFTLFVPTISVFLLLLIIDVCAIFPSFMRSLSYVCHLSVCLYQHPVISLVAHMGDLIFYLSVNNVPDRCLQSRSFLTQSLWKFYQCKSQESSESAYPKQLTIFISQNPTTDSNNLLISTICTEFLPLLLPFPVSYLPLPLIAPPRMTSQVLLLFKPSQFQGQFLEPPVMLGSSLFLKMELHFKQPIGNMESVLKLLVQFSSVQSLSLVRLFATPRIA